MWVVDWDGPGPAIEAPTEQAARNLVHTKTQAGIKRVVYYWIDMGEQQ